MPRSFKLKMALFSLCTSGAILLAFASLFLSAIRRAGLERVDRQLQALVENQLRHPLQEGHWSRFDDSLSAVYGENSRRHFLMQVVGPDGASVYTSPHWSAALTNATLSFPDPSMPRADTQDPQSPMPRSIAQPNGNPRERDAFAVPPPLRAHERPDDEPPHRLSPPPDPRQPPSLARPNQDFPPRRRFSPPQFLTVRANGQDWRFIAMRNPNVTLRLGTDMAEFHAEIHRFISAYALAVPLGLLLLASGGWLLAKQALRPVQILTQVAANITAKGLDRRVRTEDADQEFQALTDVINGMLNRLEVSFRQAARFSADAAHELKTPLTILQGQLDQALRNAPPESKEQRTYADLLEEVQRLKVIVRKLLLLSQSDSGQMRLSLQAISLDQELEALFEDLPLLAPDLALEKDVAPDVRVMADPDLLRQILHNLISNAVKYNREHGALSCVLRRENGQALLSVSNTIVPGAAIDREKLFDRFYRGDAAHNRKVDGTGLGLSLAREISRAHGGDLTVEKAREGWISFRLSLPLASLEKKEETETRS